MKNKIINLFEEKIKKLKIEYKKGFQEKEINKLEDIKKIILARNELLNIKLEETKDIFKILNILALHKNNNYEIFLLFKVYTKLIDLIILSDLSYESYTVLLFHDMTKIIKQNIINNRIKINNDLKIISFNASVLLIEYYNENKKEKW